MLMNHFRQLASRKGSVLIVAMFVLISTAGLIMNNATSVDGVYKSLKIKLREQKVIAAAEAICGYRESDLSDRLATADFWALSAWKDNYGTQWFGDCQVKWRIEPCLIGEAEDPATIGDYYVANPSPDPNAALPTSPQQNNPDTFHYRIATEATYSEGGIPLCRAQAVRIVQLSRSMLFRYAIFYGQTGPKGDIEFAHGPNLTVMGGVHSNGAIYLGGGGSPSTSGISGVQSGGVTTIGTSSTKMIVTGIDGIFAMNKRYNYYFKGASSGAYTGPDANAPDPMLITDSNLLYTGGSARSINGKNLTSTNDTRADVNWKTNSLSASVGWGGWLRTKQTGASIVKTLTNIPQLNGRPFEPQQLSDDPTVDEPEYSRKLLYFDPANYTADSQPTLSDDGTLATATYEQYKANGLYLNYALGSKEFGGIGRTKRAPATGTWTGYEMLLDNPAGGTTQVSPKSAGLIIRERPNQAGVTVWTAYSAITAATHAAYMKERYQVFLGRADITQGFFNHIYTSGGVAYRCATEDKFVERRQYWAQGTYTAATMPMMNVITINMDALQDFLKTKRISDVQVAGSLLDGAGVAHLSTSPDVLISDLGGTTAQAATTDRLKTHFNGLIYIHRFPRVAARVTERLPYSTAVRPQALMQAVRISRGSTINWDHDTNNDGVDDPNSLGTSKLTIVTPNCLYLQGDFNSVTKVDASGVQQRTPVAIFCDMLTVQSGNWSDAVQALPNTSSPASTTSYYAAIVVNNAPTTQSLKSDDASVHTFGWYIEDWGGQTFHFTGSIVVLNDRRYTMGFNTGATRAGTPGTDLPPDRASPAPVLYGAPTRNINFNNDLMTTAGTPPYAPFGIAVNRQVSYSYLVLNR